MGVTMGGMTGGTTGWGGTTEGGKTGAGAGAGVSIAACCADPMNLVTGTQSRTDGFGSLFG